jgi:hypothetical protein
LSYNETNEFNFGEYFTLENNLCWKKYSTSDLQTFNHRTMELYTSNSEYVRLKHCSVLKMSLLEDLKKRFAGKTG